MEKIEKCLNASNIDAVLDDAADFSKIKRISREAVKNQIYFNQIFFAASRLRVKLLLSYSFDTFDFRCSQHPTGNLSRAVNRRPNCLMAYT